MLRFDELLFPPGPLFGSFGNMGPNLFVLGLLNGLELFLLPGPLYGFLVTSKLPAFDIKLLNLRLSVRLVNRSVCLLRSIDLFGVSFSTILLIGLLLETLGLFLSLRII